MYPNRDVASTDGTHRNIEIKYIKEAEDDADIDPDWTVSDAFVDYGKAEENKADQRATIKLIRKTIEGLPLRAGSVVPELTLPQYQRPVSRRPPVPVPNFGPQTSTLGKRTSAAAFANQSAEPYDGVDISQPSRPALAQIAEEDLPVSSIERDEGPVVLEDDQSLIPNGNTVHDGPNGLNEEPKSESEEQEVPSTYADEQPEEVDGLAGHQDYSRPTSIHRDQPVATDDDYVDINRLVPDDYLPKTALAAPGASREYSSVSGSRRQSQVPITPTSLTPAAPQSKFVNSDGRLARPNRPPFKDWQLFRKSTPQRQEKRKANAFDIPESEIEDSQQDPAPSTSKRRRVAVSRLTPPGPPRSSVGSRTIHGLLDSNARVLADGNQRIEQFPNYTSPVLEEDNGLLDLRNDQNAAAVPLADEVQEAVQHISGIHGTNEGVGNDKSGQVSTTSDAPLGNRAGDFTMEDQQRTRNPSTSRSEAAQHDSDSDKENSKPSGEDTGADTTMETESQQEIAIASEDDEDDDNLNGQGATAGLNDDNNQKPSNKSPGLKVLREVKQTKSKQKKADSKETPQPRETAEAAEMPDDGTEKHLGLGITQSPNRRRRTSSFVGSVDVGTNSHSSVLNTRPFPKGRKVNALDFTKGVPRASTPSDNTQQKQRSIPVETSASRKESEGSQDGLGASASTIGQAGTNNNENISASRSDTSHQTVQNQPTGKRAKRPSLKSSSPEMTRLTKTGKILPPGMSEEEYNRMVSSYNPNDPANKKKGTKSTKKPVEEKSVEVQKADKQSQDERGASETGNAADYSTVTSAKPKSRKAAKKPSKDADVHEEANTVAEAVVEKPKKKARSSNDREQVGAEAGQNGAGPIAKKPRKTRKLKEQEQEKSTDGDVVIPGTGDHVAKSTMPTSIEVEKASRDKTVTTAPAADALETAAEAKKSKKSKRALATPVTSFESIAGPSKPVKKSDAASNPAKLLSNASEEASSSTKSSKTPQANAIRNNESNPQSLKTDKKKSTSTASSSNPPYKNPKAAVTTHAHPVATSSPTVSPAPSTVTTIGVKKGPLRPLMKPQPSLQSLKHDQAAAKREREEKEKLQLRKQYAAPPKTVGKSGSKLSAPSLLDDDDEDDESSESESETDSSGDEKKKGASQVFGNGGKKNGDTSSTNAAKSSTPSSKAKSKSNSMSQSEKDDESTTSDATTTTSSSSSSETKAGQENGSAIKSTKSATKTNAKRGRKVEGEGESDDTDIVKSDRTPPPKSKVVAAPVSKALSQASAVGKGKEGPSRWGFGRLTNWRVSQ